MAGYKSPLDQLLDIRSQLAEEILAYLKALMRETAMLPPYYPSHLRTNGAGETRFDDIRQQVQVVEDRSVFEQWRAEQAERTRSAGLDWERLAYAHRAARPEEIEPGDRQDIPKPAPPVPWDEEAANCYRRAIILSDPGFGKSWLLRYEARRLARQAYQALRDHQTTLADLHLPLLARLSDVNRSDAPLEEELVNLISNGRSLVFQQWLRQKLATKECTVLLDAWDEVPLEPVPDGQPVSYRPGYRQRLGLRLAAFAQRYPKPDLLLTSRIVGYGQTPIANAQELELIAFDMPQIEAFTQVWFAEVGQASQFLAMLQQNHAVRGLARIPLMLALLCRAYHEEEMAFPTRRVDLYQRCLRGFLLDWQAEDKGEEQISLAYVDGLLELLAGVAERLFIDGYEQFSESVLRQQMLPFVQALSHWHELYGRNAAALIAHLKRVGILVQAGERQQSQLLFLHRTFHEYLVAQALAARVNQNGWADIAALVDKKAWRPEWQQVIVLLAGQLDDPTPLLQMLANPKPTATNPHGDDYYRHRLTLAALCLAETRPTWRESQVDLVSSIATDAFLFWWHHDFFLERGMLARYWGAVSHVAGQAFLNLLSDLLQDANRRVREAAVAAVAEIYAASTRPFLAQLVKMLRDESWKMRRAAAVAVGRIGAAAATEPILVRLVELLRDEDRGVREAAVAAVHSIGGAVATEPLLARLAELLQDADKEVRREAARAVGGIGAAAATKPILARLMEMLHDADEGVKRAAADAVVKIGGAATEPVLAQLVEMLRDEDARVRGKATRAMVKICGAATEPILAWLAEMLRDADRWVRAAAAGTVGGIGAAAATEPILAQLVELLRDADKEVRRKAGWAMRKMGAAGATEPILVRLVELLRDEDGRVRQATAQAVHSIGGAVATEPLLAQLAELLQDADKEVRREAAWAVGGIGAAAATESILAQLVELLRDADKEVRREAARAVREMGAAAATEPILAQLVGLLRDEDGGIWSVRAEAAWAVREMGAAAATEPILTQLAELLQDADKEVRREAARAVGGIGAAATTESILAQLVELLRDADKEVRREAARAVGEIGTAAATEPILAQLVEFLWDEDAWARSEATRAVSNMVNAGLRIFPSRMNGRWRFWTGRHWLWLSLDQLDP